jgi:uncharacterized damage-inducible protein DinB
MSISASLLPELEHEYANTRKMLERVPEASFGWKPHEKSMTLGTLAGHVAEVPDWMDITINRDVLDFAEFKYVPPVHTTTASLLAAFDKSAAAAKAALAAATDEQLFQNWTMRNGEQVFFTMPKVAVVRSFVMNHLVHHRGQLSVYLRLLDVPLPGMYGPTADEG